MEVDINVVEHKFLEHSSGLRHFFIRRLNDNGVDLLTEVCKYLKVRGLPTEVVLHSVQEFDRCCIKMEFVAFYGKVELEIFLQHYDLFTKFANFFMEENNTLRPVIGLSIYNTHPRFDEARSLEEINKLGHRCISAPYIVDDRYSPASEVAYKLIPQLDLDLFYGMSHRIIQEEFYKLKEHCNKWLDNRFSTSGRIVRTLNKIYGKDKWAVQPYGNIVTGIRREEKYVVSK